MAHVARALIVTALEMIEFLRIAANNGFVFVIVYIKHLNVNMYHPGQTLLPLASAS